MKISPILLALFLTCLSSVISAQQQYALPTLQFPLIPGNTIICNPAGTTGFATSCSTLPSGTSVPASALPGLTGDVNSSSGSSATTVVRINGASLPANAPVIATNSSGQVTAASTTGTGNVVLGNGASLTGANLGTPSSINLSNATALPASALPNPSSSTLGGVQSAAAAPHQWIDSVSTSGVPHLSQPSAGDVLNSPNVVDATNATYGADPTGINDSATAIQGALNTTNDTFLPCGTYKITSGLTSTGHQKLFGQGKGCVTIKPAGNFDAFTCNGGNGCGVTDLTINGVNQTGGRAVVLENAGRDYIHNVVIVSAQNGIFVETCNVCEIHDVWINAVSGTYAVQWYGDNTHRSDVLDIDNLIVGGSGSPTSSSAECILMDGNVNTMDLRHAGCTNMLRGLHVQNSSGGSAPQFVTTDDFQVDFPYAEGIRVEGGARSIFLKDSYAQASSTADGIYFDSTVQNAEVLGGQISSNFQRGIAALGRYIKVVSAQVTTNSQAGSALWPEIEIGGSSFGNTVTSSLVGQWIGYASELASYGVKTDTGAVDYSIVGNVLCANVTGAYLDSAADANSIIFGNSCATSTLSNLAAPGSGNLFVGNANGHIAEYSASNANTVNYVHYFGSITGVSPIVQCDGTDSNVNCVYAARGTGNWFWKYNGGGTVGFALSGSDGGVQIYNAGTAPSGGDKGAGTINAASTIYSQATMSTGAYTIAGLPSCSSTTKGQFAYVTNGTSPTYLGTVGTTGTTVAPVFCDGTNWLYH